MQVLGIPVGIENSPVALLIVRNWEEQLPESIAPGATAQSPTSILQLGECVSEIIPVRFEARGYW